MNQGPISIHNYFNMDIEQRCMQHNLARIKRYDLHSILNENISERERVAIITELNRRQLEDGIPQNYGQPQMHIPGRYSLLLSISKVLWVSSWIMFGVGIISLLVHIVASADSYSRETELIILGFQSLINYAIIGISLMATSGLIKMWVDMAQSNLDILEILKRR